MKEIKAVIQPIKLHSLREALVALPEFPGMSVSHIEGCSPSKDRNGHMLNLREELIEFSPKVRIEIISPDEQVDEIVCIIHQVCHTGRTGDGIVWVTQVAEFLRIRHLDQSGDP
jgi:nitrogen regulatory protein P-II 1